ncbi:MAG: AI-2E family transporter [Armatimonadetes bacterium]|nr:AI-2E family transporter [Armatimonadota bacterium]
MGLSQDSANRSAITIGFGELVKLLLLALGLVVGLRFLGQIAQVLLLFSLAIILAMMLTAPVSWLERRRVPRWFGSLVVIVGLFGLAILVGLWFAPPLVEQTSVLIERTPDYVKSVQQWLLDMTATYPSLQNVVELDEQTTRDIVARAESVLLRAGKLVLNVLGGLAALLVVVVMTVFTLVHPRPLLRGLFGMIPEDLRWPVARALHKTAQQMRVWAWSSTLIGLVDGSIAYFGLTLLGVQPALLLAALVFLGEFFPYVGPIAAGIPAVALALTVSPLTALWVVILYLGLHQLEASFLNPLIVSRQMRFHPLSVGFGIIALGTVYGVLGAFLAIPALAAIKAFYTELVLNRRELDEQRTEDCANLVLESAGTSQEAPEPENEGT